MRRGARGAAGMVALATLVMLAAAGCTTVVAGNPTAASQSSASSRSSAPSTSAGPTEVVTTGDASFSSPTGNIGCVVFDKPDTVEARCDISQKRWQPPPKPADCQLAYGQGIALGDTAAVVCAGDTALGAPKQLSYGSAVKVGRFLCTSREAGMTCENTQTGHGFELSQESYRIF
jgi:hypothetical protein